jgi:hypothetical protein
MHLDKVGLILLIPRCHQPVYLSTQPYLCKSDVRNGYLSSMGDSPFHHRRKVHTILIILSCLVDSGGVREDNPSGLTMGQISDLHKYKPNHGRGTIRGSIRRRSTQSSHYLAKSCVANISRHGCSM